MLKKILLALIFVITAITNVTYAEDDMKTVASKAYVDTKIETKQLKIPAAGQPNVGAGETVMTYTSTGNGQIGERGLYSDISSYDATTDGDKLITASALNATFTNLPTTPTTKLECANQADGCTLWTIVDQTAYGKSRNLFNKNMPNVLINGFPRDDGTFVSQSAFRIVIYPLQIGETYTITRATSTPTQAAMRVIAYNTQQPQNADNGVVLSIGPTSSKTATITVPEGYPYVATYVKHSNDVISDAELLDGFQIELGSTATPYEPYY